MVSQYHIVAVGPPGSGKTVYLSALYNAFVGHSMAKGLAFSVSLADGAWLRSIYDRLADPLESFPESTSSSLAMREVLFKASVTRQAPSSFFKKETKLLNYPLFNITYIDYAGEWVTEQQNNNSSVVNPFIARLREAHSLLCLIDGARLLDFMENPGQASDFLKQEFRPVVDLASDFPKPVHFVITKWDLLSEKFTLHQVNARLIDSAYTGFRNLIENRTAQGRWGRLATGTVRLIPVSSTGDFVRLDNDGKVVKVAGKVPSAVNVELPLVAAIADICDLAIKQVRRDMAAIPSVDTKRSDTVEQLFDETKKAVESVPVSIFGISLDLRQVTSFALTAGMELTGKMSRPARRFGRLLRRPYRRIRARGLGGVTNPESALFYAAIAFRQKLLQFMDEEQGSILWVATDE